MSSVGREREQDHERELLERDRNRERERDKNRDKDRNKEKLRDKDKMKKTGRYGSFLKRTLSTVFLLALLLVIIYCGHLPLVGLVFTCQFLMVKELFKLALVAQQEKTLPGFRAQQWYFYAVATFYLYLRFIQNNVINEVTQLDSSQAWLRRVCAFLLKHHNILGFLAYVAGFIMFVLSLKKGSYLYQFGQYAWTHMIIMVVFVPSSFFISNIFEGIIWFLLPILLIVTNDIMAYLFGITLGRTPLIRLSPKKTWEGFIGATFATTLIAPLLAWALSRYSWFICPRKDLSFFGLACSREDIYAKLGPIYESRIYSAHDLEDLLPDWLLQQLLLLREHFPAVLLNLVDSAKIQLSPMQLHAMVLAMFASIIGPFGGFFASGFKRALKVKDFGDTIPGHGGVTDRFDCQMMMAMFSYLYYWNYLVISPLDVDELLKDIVQLDRRLQVQLFTKLGKLLFDLAAENVTTGLPGDLAGLCNRILETYPVRNQTTPLT